MKNDIKQNVIKSDRKAARAVKARWLEEQCREIGRYHGENKTREA